MGKAVDTDDQLAAVDDGRVFSESNLPEFGARSSDGMTFKAAKGRDYVMPGGVNLPATMTMLRDLKPVLAAARSTASQIDAR